MLEIKTFGGFQIAVDGQREALNNRKSQAMLGYLASNSHQPVERAVLAALLWPDLAEDAALNNLSKALGHLRSLFKQAGIDALRASRQSVQLINLSHWQLDLQRFGRLIDEARSTDTETAVRRLEEAAALYRGEFLAGLSLDDCPTFEGWLLLQRESLMLKARDSHQQVAEHYLRQREYAVARNHARAQLAIDPWHEEAYRQLMHALEGLDLRSDALACYESCQAILSSELGLEPEQSTRDLYERIKAGRSASVPVDQVEARSRALDALPKLLVPLVGRDRELDSLVTDLRDPACRLLTVAGPGGVGKTSLALEVAWRAAGNFRDAAFFVPLESIQPSAVSELHEQLAAAVGAVLGMPFTGTEPVPRQLFKHLANLEALLVLDNFEHLLIEPAESNRQTSQDFLQTLLEQAPAVKVLATSRERFNIPAEFVLSLDGLPVPDLHQDLLSLSENSSVRLFVTQAKRLERNFQLTPDNGVAVAEICSLTDGLPLGIELAARWVTHFTPAEIAAAIQEDLNFLAVQSPQPSKRHQSIRATFAYSWRMLTAEEQRMLAGLSMIRGQFGREAALTITEGSLGVLVRLQSKSLIRQEGPGHYGLHQLLRTYAAEHLARHSAEDLAALQRRYMAYYLGLLAEQGTGFDQPWSGEAVKTIGRHIDDIRGAWQMALDTLSFDLISQALQPLYHYYRIQGLFFEAKRVFARAADCFLARGEVDPGDSLAIQLLGRALLRQGRLAYFMLDIDQAERWLREGLDRLQQMKADIDRSRGYVYLGEVVLRKGRLEEAAALLDQALALYQEERNSHGVALTRELQAVIASQTGQLAQANHLYQESISISRENRNRRLEGRAYHDWGMMLLGHGEIDRAAVLFQDSQTIAVELDLRMPIAFNQSMLARIMRHHGDHQQSRELLERSLEVLEGSGYSFYIVRTLTMLGEVLVLSGHNRASLAALEKALAVLIASQTAVTVIDKQAILDFFLAAGYYFSATGQVKRAVLCLQLVREHAVSPSDLDLRIQQLVAELPEGDLGGEPVPEHSKERPLLETLMAFRF